MQGPDQAQMKPVGHDPGGRVEVVMNDHNPHLSTMVRAYTYESLPLLLQGPGSDSHLVTHTVWMPATLGPTHAH